jgi:hypothetical protein
MNLRATDTRNHWANGVSGSENGFFEHDLSGFCTALKLPGAQPHPACHAENA